MICLILAAGYATRLYPLTENYPKPLLDVQGRTVLDWLLTDVDGIEGIEKYVVVSNHKFYDHFTTWVSIKPNTPYPGYAATLNYRYQLKPPQFPQESLNGALRA